jgi:hypothetical protein
LEGITEKRNEEKEGYHVDHVLWNDFCFLLEYLNLNYWRSSEKMGLVQELQWVGELEQNHEVFVSFQLGDFAKHSY